MGAKPPESLVLAMNYKFDSDISNINEYNKRIQKIPF